MNLLDHPNDIISIIILYLPEINIRRINKRLCLLYDNIIKNTIKYKYFDDIVKNGNIGQILISFIYNIYRVRNWEHIARYVVKNNLINLIKYCILTHNINTHKISKEIGIYGNLNLARELNIMDWKYIGIGASKGNNIDIIHYIYNNPNITINKWSFWEFILMKAIKYHNNNIVYYILKNKKVSAWSMIILYASQYDNSEILQYMFSRNLIDYKYLAMGAARNGNKILINKCIINGEDNYNRIAINAAIGGHLDIIHDMISYGCRCYNFIALKAAKYGHIHIIDNILKYNINNWIDIAISATYKGHIDIIKYAINMLENNNTKLDLSEIANIAAQYGHLKILKYIMTKEKLEYNKLYDYAKCGKYIHIMKYLNSFFNK